jgi:16S rRNA (uracil1498-N3)-methyltransferase
MHRFFVPPNCLQHDQISLPDEQAYQVRTVLRMKPGQQIIVLDNAGWEYAITLTKVSSQAVMGNVIDKRPSANEPATQITLYQSLTKRDKFEWILQKGTELGIRRFVPLVSQRSLVTNTGIKPNKLARWRKIITEAAEQSRRGRIPELQPPLKLDEAWTHVSQYDLALMPWAQAEEGRLRQALEGETAVSVALFIGPEGGFTAEEVENGRQHNVKPITLGRRILRTETAAIVATALVLHELNEME